MRSDPASQTGFTLVETVAAMGILALAAVPLMQLASDATNNASHLETRLLARTVAENVLARAIADPEQIDGGTHAGQEGQLGRAYTWTLIASPPRQGEVQSLNVTVWQEGDAQPLSTMQSLKAIARPVAPVAVTDSEEEE